MRFSKYLVAAALAGVAAAAVSTGTLAQAQKAPPPSVEAIRAAATAAGITDPDAVIQLEDFMGQHNPTGVACALGRGECGLHARGCVPSDKVYGEQAFSLDGFRFGGCLARGADKNTDALRVLIKAAQATGQFRNNAYAFAGGNAVSYLILGDSTAFSRVVGKGQWMGQDADLRLEWDYRIPAARLYVTGADGKESIFVTTDPRKPPTGRIGHLEQPEIFGNGPVEGLQQVTWMEEPAGVYAGPSKMPSNELLAIAYALPSGVVLAGRDAADVMKLSKDDQANDVLTIPVHKLNDATLVATLDASGRPVHTEITVDGKKYTGDFSNFLNDRMDMEQHFPFQASIQMDGKPLISWDLDYFHADPYLVFPVPAEAATK